MIVDAHVHAGEYYRHYSARFAEQMTASTELAPEDLSAPEAKLLAEMDAAGVDRVFLLAFDVQRVEGFSVPNEFVAELCARHSDRLTGFASVDAGVPGAAGRLREAVTGLGLRGLKTAPCYLRMSPADRRWYEVYETAMELGIPVLMHTGYTPSRNADPRFFSPLLVERVARDFPDLTVILAHLGTPGPGRASTCSPGTPTSTRTCPSSAPTNRPRPWHGHWPTPATAVFSTGSCGAPTSPSPP